MKIKFGTQIMFMAVFGWILKEGWQNVDQWYEDDQIEEATSARSSNVYTALRGVIFVILAQSILNPYIDKIFSPRKRTWRFIAKSCSLYLYFLVFVYYQNTQDARKFFGFIHPKLGKPVPESYHTYDDDCSVNSKTILDNMDHYFLIHFINWFMAAIILRDAPMLHFWSILDEVLELSAQHVLPHFRECWWDHIFHDVLLTNTPGIILGLKFCEWIKLEKYDWLGRKGKDKIIDWGIWHCHRRFGGFCYGIFIISVNFLTGFFMINALWIPPTNPLVVFRLLIWFLLGNITFKEAWHDINTWNTVERKDNPVEARYRWLTFGVIVMETAISFKFIREAGNLVENPVHPPLLCLFWAITFIVCIAFYLRLRFKPDRTRLYITEEPKKRRTRRSVRKSD